MTSMRARAIDVAAAAFREAGVRAPRTQASTAVDALLAAGMLADPEECARTYSLISELIATGNEDEMMRYLRAARAFGRQRDEALVSTPPRAALAAAEEDAS